MAVNKEAIVIVLDVGCSMCSDSPSVLQKAKACINMILQRKIFSESKDEIGLILYGTPETANNLADPDGIEYSHIKVAQELKIANWQLLHYVQDVEGSDIVADFVDALVVAMDILQTQTSGKKFSSRRILFFSNFDGKFCDDQISIIIQGMKIAKMELNVIGPVAFTDDDSQNDDPLLAGKSKTAEQIRAEKVIQRILKEVNGESYSFSEALPALTYYQKKRVQPTSWNANLEIGTTLTIPISGFVKITECKTKGWKNAYAQRYDARIEKETTYHLNDDAQSEISKDKIISAFRYGTTLVPYSEEDKAIMEYQSGEKGMKVLGFTKGDKIHWHHYVGDKTMYITGQKNNELAGEVLAAFIQALYETKMVAIVRYVYGPRSAPKIGFLSPRIKPRYECLVFIALPFMEDLRHYVFPPLDSNAKNLPTEEQLSVVNELINAMDLSTAAEDEEGNRGEALKPKNTVNPNLQRLYQCLQHRVLNLDGPLPDLPPHIRAVIEPAPELVKSAEPVIKKMKKIFPLKEVVLKKTVQTGASLFGNVKSENSGKEAKKFKADGDSQGNVGVVEDKIEEVGTVQPTQDFQHLINQPNKQFSEICKQLERAVLRLLGDAMVKALYGKIFACLRMYREETIKREEPKLFNQFMKELKGILSTQHHQLWTQILEAKLGLITSTESSRSDASAEQASEFLSTKLVQSEAAELEEADEDDDLLAQM